MPEQVILEDTRIDFCDWSVAGGSLRYDISHLHPDWGFLVQSYRIDTQDFDGRYIYTSEFILFPTNSVSELFVRIFSLDPPLSCRPAQELAQYVQHTSELTARALPGSTHWSSR